MPTAVACVAPQTRMDGRMRSGSGGSGARDALSTAAAGGGLKRVWAKPWPVVGGARRVLPACNTRGLAAQHALVCSGHYGGMGARNLLTRPPSASFLWASAPPAPPPFCWHASGTFRLAEGLRQRVLPCSRRRRPSVPSPPHRRRHGGGTGWSAEERRRRVLAMLEEGDDEDVDWEALTIKVGRL